MRFLRKRKDWMINLKLVRGICVIADQINQKRLAITKKELLHALPPFQKETNDNGAASKQQKDTTVISCSMNDTW
jgi:hypothetical protein